jgi:hypothetical protein
MSLTATGGLPSAIASPSSADPIFEVIERHRKAIDLLDETSDHFLAMDALHPREEDPEDFLEWSSAQRTAYRDAEIARMKGHPINVAWDAWNDQVNAVAAITQELIDTAPTTVAGVAAALAHWAYVAGTGDDFDANTAELLERLAEALRRLA